MAHHLILVIACKEKAQFLLKFAGLQRITDKGAEVSCSLSPHEGTTIIVSYLMRV